jgi:hypothetical protein
VAAGVVKLDGRRSQGLVKRWQRLALPVEALSSKEKAADGFELGDGDQRHREELEDRSSMRRRPAGLGSTGGATPRTGDVREGDGQSASFGPDNGAQSSGWMCASQIWRGNVLRWER